MSAPVAQHIDHVPGYLCADPTDLSAAFPHGGTALGVCRDQRFRPGTRHFPVVAEEFGQVVEGVYVGQSGVFVAVMRQLDDDMLLKMFRGAAAGTSGRTLVGADETDDADRAGIAPTPVVLYFSPLSDTQPGIILYRAVPLVDQAAEINGRLDDDVGTAVMFLATPDDQGRSYAIGLRGDLSL